MSTEYNAKLGYGIKVTDDKLYQRIDSDDLELDREFKMMVSGNEYYNEGMTFFICIRESMHHVNMYDDLKSPIKQSKLIAPTNWHDMLEKWAEENDCSNPKVGWWLCVSES